MNKNIELIKEIILRNKKIIENYFFMTLLIFLNATFSLLLYPYLIRTLGASSYGIYIFITTVINYFIVFISFGFDLLGTRKIALHKDSIEQKSDIVSSIFSVKIALFLFSSIIAICIYLVSPLLQNHKWIYITCFLNTLTNILFPIWYFQGIQKMKVVTLTQLTFKLLTLPFIFYFIKKPNDLLLFSTITNLSILFSSIFAFAYLVIVEKISLKIVSLKKIRKYIKEAFYFFSSIFLTALHSYTLNLIIGLRWGMTDLAIYDLATKIVQIPTMLVASINDALFPRMVANFNVQSLKKIIKIERIIGITVVALIITFGKLAVNLLGNEGMYMAYPIAIILSFRLYATLQVACYTSLTLIPNHLDSYILKDLLIVTLELFICLAIGFALSNSIFIIPISMTLIVFFEIVYLKYITNKKVFNKQ